MSMGKFGMHSYTCTYRNMYMYVCKLHLHIFYIHMYDVNHQSLKCKIICKILKTNHANEMKGKALTTVKYHSYNFEKRLPKPFKFSTLNCAFSSNSYFSFSLSHTQSGTRAKTLVTSTSLIVSSAQLHILRNVNLNN